MKEVQRHNFEFIRTEVMGASIDDFAKLLMISKSTYQRMRSENNTADYSFPYIQQVCEVADLSIDVFSRKKLTPELYAKYKGTFGTPQVPDIKPVKRQQIFIRFGIFFVIAICVTLVILAIQLFPKINPVSYGSSSDISVETKPSSTELPDATDKLYYWTDKEGGAHHLNRNCPAIKNRNNIEFGALEEAHQKKKFSPCDYCVFE